VGNARSREGGERTVPADKNEGNHEHQSEASIRQGH